MEATLADWITAVFTIVLAVFTAALVRVTTRYVAHTERLVTETQKSREEAEKGREQSTEESRLTREEMRASREESRLTRHLSVLPKLAINLETITGMFVGLKLTNVGQGPALEVELVIAFEPEDGGLAPRDERVWRTKVLARDEWVRFVPPRGEQGDPLEVPALGYAYSEITVKGRMRDALGQEHEIDEYLHDLAGLHKLTTGAMVLVEEDPGPRELRRLRKSFDKAAKELLKGRAGEAQSARPHPVRSRILRALGRSNVEEPEFEQSKWWERHP